MRRQFPRHNLDPKYRSECLPYVIELYRGVEKTIVLLTLRKHMNVVPRSTMNTNGEQRINSEV